jgi:hypothetical protein
MRLSSQQSAFIFNFPVDFISPRLYERFQLYIENEHMPYDNALDYINSTIKEIVFPSSSFETTEQRIRYGKTMAWRSSKNIFDNFQKELDVTFRSVDSHMNYMLMLEIIDDYYQNTKKPYIPTFSLNILDKHGDLTYTVLFKNIILKTLSEQRFQYQMMDVNEKSFSVTFLYNYLDIIWEIREKPMDPTVSIFDVPVFPPTKQIMDDSDKTFKDPVERITSR